MPYAQLSIERGWGEGEVRPICLKVGITYCSQICIYACSAGWPWTQQGRIEVFFIFWKMGIGFAFFLCCLNPHIQLLKDHYFVFLFIDKTNQRFGKIVLSADAALCQYFSCPRLVPGLSSWSVLSRTNLGQAKDRKRICKGPHRQKVQIYRIFEIHRFTWYVLISLRHCTPLQIVYRLRRHIIR